MQSHRHHLVEYDEEHLQPSSLERGRNPAQGVPPLRVTLRSFIVAGKVLRRG